MSDTPRTDALWLKLNRGMDAIGEWHEIWDLARELERDLAANQAEVARLLGLRKVLDELAKP